MAEIFIDTAAPETQTSQVPLREYYPLAQIFHNKRQEQRDGTFKPNEFNRATKALMLPIYEREKQSLVSYLYSCILDLAVTYELSLSSDLDEDLLNEATITMISLKLLMVSSTYGIPQTAIGSYFIALEFFTERLITSLGLEGMITATAVIRTWLGDNLYPRVVSYVDSVPIETPLAAAQRLNIPLGAVHEEIDKAIIKTVLSPVELEVAEHSPFTRSIVYPGNINILPGEPLAIAPLYNSTKKNWCYFDKEEKNVCLYYLLEVGPKSMMLALLMSVQTYERLKTFLEICLAEDIVGFDRRILLEIPPEGLQYYEAVWELARMFGEERAEHGLYAHIPTGIGPDAVSACGFGDIHANPKYIEEGLAKLAELSEKLFGEELDIQGIRTLIQNGKLAILFKGDFSHSEPKPNNPECPILQRWLHILEAIAKYEEKHQIILGSTCVLVNSEYGSTLERDIEAENRLMAAMEEDPELRGAIWTEIELFLQGLQQFYNLKKLNPAGVISVRGNHENILEKLSAFEKTISEIFRLYRAGKLTTPPFSPLATRTFSEGETTWAYREPHIYRAGLRFFLGEEGFQQIIEMENNMPHIAQGGKYLLVHTSNKNLASSVSKVDLQTSTSGEVDTNQLMAIIGKHADEELVVNDARAALGLEHDVMALLGHSWPVDIGSYNVSIIRWPDQVEFIPDTRTTDGYRVVDL